MPDCTASIERSDPQPPHNGAELPPVTRYSYFVAASLGAIYTLNFLDRQFLAVLAEPVRRDLGLSDTELGMLTGLMFALFYTFCGIPVASLADRTHRMRLIAIACGIWSLFTAACGLATSFIWLALARIGVGIGEAGGAAPSYSVIADYFPRERRGVGLAIMSLGVPAGTVIGTFCGGWIAAHYGWRAAFISLGIFGLLLAPVIPLLVREPIRGRMDVAEHNPIDTAPASARQAIAFFVSQRSLVLTALAAGLTALVLYGIVNWLPSFLLRQRGMQLTDLATYYSLVAGISTAAGTWLGGFVADRLGSKNPALYTVIPGVAALIAVPFLFAVTNAADWRVAIAWLTVPLVLLNMYLAPALAVMQNGVPSQFRATTGAIFLFVLNLIGLGCGPVFVGMMSDWLKPTVGGDSLRQAIQWLWPFMVLAALAQVAACRALWLAARKT